MNCPNCHNEIPDDSKYCPKCGYNLSQNPVNATQDWNRFNDPQYTRHIPNNLVWAILTTIFCCLPFGIVSIVYAAKVDGLVAERKYADAEKASRNARNWAIVAAVVHVCLVIVYCIFAFLFWGSVTAFHVMHMWA